MNAMASQITSLASVYSTVYSGADQRKHQSSASLAFVRGIHRWPMNSPQKGPVTWKMFPFDNVIMNQHIMNIKISWTHASNNFLGRWYGMHCMSSIFLFLWMDRFGPGPAGSLYGITASLASTRGGCDAGLDDNKLQKYDLFWNRSSSLTNCWFWIGFGLKC